MGLKIRVAASHGPRKRGPVPPIVYRAEAYEEADGFREPRWGCGHEHETVEHALNCGMDWLSEREQAESA